MGRLFLGLISLAFWMTGCAPDDPNVRPGRRDNFAQSRSEKSQVKGLDYVEYLVYRLAEVKLIVDAAISQPGKLEEFDGPACGQMVIDRVGETSRQQRFETVNCTIHNDESSGVTLKADGVDVIESARDANGRLERLWMRAVVPHQITGSISSSKEKAYRRAGSTAAIKERRELSLDFLNESESRRHYRFSYSVELNWNQEIKGENFKAFEDGATNTVVVTGSLWINGDSVDQLQIDQGRLETFAPRTIVGRDKYTKGRTPDDATFHKVSLRLKAGKEDEKGKSRLPLQFGKDSCGLPSGALDVDSYKGGSGDDKLTKKDESAIVLSSLGIEVKATGQIRSWPDCKPDSAAPPVLGKRAGFKGQRFEPKAGEIRNRIPYQELLFK